MGDFFRVTVSGLESIDADFNASMLDLKRACGNGTKTLTSELVYRLTKHIASDVYLAYTPKSYPRRVENPNFGPSLMDSSTMETRTEDLVAELVYTPSGRHSGLLKDALNANEDGGESGMKPLKPHPVHGDALIERIQTGHGYDWKLPKDFPGGRPFWNNFVTEMQNGGAWDAFEKGFTANQPPDGWKLIREGGELDVLFEPGESLLEGQADLPL